MIEMEVIIEGNGLVNFNGRKNPSLGHATGYDNAKYAKEHVYMENGELKAKKIISSNLLRKEILGSDTMVSAQLVLDSKALRLKVISDRKMLMRGWLYAGSDANSNNTIRRKSPITIIAAEQIGNTSTKMELCTSRDMTTDTEGSTKKSSTSLFTKETIGDIQYKTTMLVDMKSLQLMSFDDRFDRMACKEDELLEFIKNLESKGYTCEKDAYYTNSNDMSIAEQCVKFDEKFLRDSLIDLYKNTISMNITRSDAFAKTAKIGVRFLYENDDVILNSKNDFAEINSLDEFKKLIETIELGYDFQKDESKGKK